jgi:uncharacterized membrane protein
LYVSSLIYVGLVFGITILISLAAQYLIWRISKGMSQFLNERAYGEHDYSG